MMWPKSRRKATVLQRQARPQPLKGVAEPIRTLRHEACTRGRLMRHDADQVREVHPGHRLVEVSDVALGDGVR